MVMAQVWSVILLFLFISNSVPYVLAKFIVERHSLTITSPENLKGTYESAIANFGIPLYGGSMVGTIVYYPSSKGECTPFTDGSTKVAKTTGSGSLPVIALIDRGNCYFTTKVWEAQGAGASAVLVADDKEENLITMDAPEEDPETASVSQNITIPSALIRKNTSDAIKKALKTTGSGKGLVIANLDWREALPHPDDRVEYEFWTNSNDECGPKCNMQSNFVASFKGVAQTMEKGGYTQFTPHYITWYCPDAYKNSKQCKSQCINNGRYCAPDPESNFEVGYDGKDVVMENLRELCVFRVANSSGSPWVWWDYVTDFKIRCKMADKNYNQACAEKVISALGVDIRKVQDCVGNPLADSANPILQEEQAAQVGKGERSDVTILPTLVINQKQYRGKLDSKAVLKAICSGFSEMSDPPQCLGAEIETNQCLQDNGGCWSDKKYSACKDTFRGRVCECPHDPVSGVTFVGDGYTSCKPAGPGRCLVNNGGCWEKEQDGVHYTACQDMLAGSGCKCPPGFSGDGKTCVDIDECASGSSVCKCKECRCKNTFGSYQCSCFGNNVYFKEHDTCISKLGSSSSSSSISWVVTLVVVACMAAVGIGGYIVYKYRLRSYMDSEIRAIMAQYMPLDSQNETGRLHEDP